MSVQPADSIRAVLFDPDSGLPYVAGAAVGGATAALQTTGNTALSSIVTALGTLNTASALPQSSTRISTATTTLVKSGAGRLSRITIGSLGTVASTVTVYNSLTATGTVLAVLNSLTLFGTFDYDLPFTTGLTVVTTGTVAPDIVVVWS